MAKPRIFISSTFYDLRQIRTDLDKFIDSMGFEAVRNEEGDISYGKDEDLQEYCYKEISSIDILVSIIGGRYGSESSTAKYSVSQKELKTAIEQNKHVYIFIEKGVASEYETYLRNKGNDSILFNYVDDKRIYSFIEEIKALRRNNVIKEFETADEIIRYLREQWAGLLKQFLLDEERNRSAFVLKDIENTAKTLRELVDYLQSANQDKDKTIQEIIRVNHPLVAKLKKEIEIPYNFYIEGRDDLSQLLNARRFRYSESQGAWRRETDSEITFLYIGDTLFDENGRLKNIKASEWSDDFLRVVVQKRDLDVPDPSDFPF